MNKVKLRVEDLHVESFTVQPESLGTGTVQGLENFDVQAESGVHSQCYTHCASGCEPCQSQSPTHCNGDTGCASWDGTCPPPPSAAYTCIEYDYTCGWDCIAQ